MLCRFDGMSEVYPDTVFAYHGCERGVAEKILGSSSDELRQSNRRGDWLGCGSYFWENAPCRAYEWAVKSPAVKDPYVLGAVVRLGKCLNLMDKNAARELRETWDWLKTAAGVNDDSLRNVGNRHYLDATVINAALAQAEDKGVPYDTVRAAYIEGAPIFEGSTLMEDTHIQIAVRNPFSVIAFFRPRGLDAYIKATRRLDDNDLQPVSGGNGS